MKKKKKLVNWFSFHGAKFFQKQEKDKEILFLSFGERFTICLYFNEKNDSKNWVSFLEVMNKLV